MILALNFCLQSVDALRGANPPSRYTNNTTFNLHIPPKPILKLTANKYHTKVSKMTDRPTDRSVSIEDTCLSRVDRDDNPLQEPAPKTYQSQDRYRRNKTKPNTEQTTVSAEESMNPKGLN